MSCHRRTEEVGGCWAGGLGFLSWSFMSEMEEKHRNRFFMKDLGGGFEYFSFSPRDHGGNDPI